MSSGKTSSWPGVIAAKKLPVRSSRRAGSASAGSVSFQSTTDAEPWSEKRTMTGGTSEFSTMPSIVSRTRSFRYGSWAR